MAGPKPTPWASPVEQMGEGRAAVRPLLLSQIPQSQYVLCMQRTHKKNRLHLGWIGAAISLTTSLHTPWASAQAKPQSSKVQPLALEQRAKTLYDAYILGPGDGLEIELVDLPELSGQFSIGPDGTLYLPRLRALYVEGLTVDELQAFLTEQFKTYVIDPQVYVRPVAYRPIRVYVGGEVKRSGYYTLSGNQSTIFNEEQDQPQRMQARLQPLAKNNFQPYQQKQLNLTRSSLTVFPTIFDAVQSAQGITPYSNLSKVQVTRRQSLTRGGGRVRAQLNFLSLITEGDESQNIRLFDGDVVNVGKSPIVLREQLIEAGQTNLTPDFMEVYVTGRVEEAGAVILPQGSSLVHAVDLAGGTKVLHGKVEFIRFTREGEVDRRIFGLNSDAPSGDYRNPVLMAGDVIRVRETPLTKSVAVLDEITAPILGVYSLYSIFDGFSN